LPTFQRADADQVATWRGKRGSAIDLGEYREFLGQVAEGEGGEITLESGEARRTVKRRLTTAANCMGKKLKYRRSEQDTICFEIV